jgi:hypothetical protein
MKRLLLALVLFSSPALAADAPPPAPPPEWGKEITMTYGELHALLRSAEASPLAVGTLQEVQSQLRSRHRRLGKTAAQASHRLPVSTLLHP